MSVEIPNLVNVSNMYATKQLVKNEIWSVK